jgi:hypothetical protein
LNAVVEEGEFLLFLQYLTIFMHGGCILMARVLGVIFKRKVGS